MKSSYRELILKGIKKYENVEEYNGNILEYASFELRNDKEIITESVKICDLNLEYTSFELQKDKEIVLISVTNIGYALKYTDSFYKTIKKLY